MTSTGSAAGQVFAPGEGEAFWFLNNLTTIRATAETTRGAYGLVESWIPPGFSPPLHVHHREDEAFWILEGVMTMRLGDQTMTGGPGSYFFLPRDVPHTFVVEGDSPAHLLTLLSPGGGEQFFVAAGRAAAHEGLPAQSPPDVERIRTAGAKFGMEILGPPMLPASRSRADV